MLCSPIDARKGQRLFLERVSTTHFTRGLGLNSAAFALRGLLMSGSGCGVLGLAEPALAPLVPFVVASFCALSGVWLRSKGL